MSRGALAPVQMQPRGLSADEAARYVGVGRTKFEEMVRTGTMPRGRRIDGRVVYDRYALDLAFNDLPEDGARRGNGIDAILNGAGGPR
jgi:excisionase family DNA binding protein